MGLTITLAPDTLKALHEVNPMLVSYNVEFAEVTGGTFWKAYTPEQIASTEPFYVEPTSEGITAMYKDLMQVYPPIDLYNEKVRKLAKDLGSAWVRVSGTWATKTYYDFDGEYADGTVPEGYLNVLTKAQWVGVLDFVKEIGAKLIVSVANCPGLHSTEEPWHPAEAEKLFGFSKEYGVPIDAAEFTNEPNMMEETGFPKGYKAEHYRRDHDLFFEWLEANYPEVIKVGPSTTGGDNVVFGKGDPDAKAGGVEQLVHETVGCDDLIGGTKTKLNFCRTYIPFRNKYVPGAEMWVTESGDAGGGDTWASTYLDVIRTLNELGGFAALTNGVIFHNTLASSDYGYLARQVFDPRPNYFAVLLWNRLMGTTAYDSAEPVREGAHVYVHSRKDGKEGKVYLIINNSRTETTTVELPKDAERYTLAGQDGNVRATVMTLNGNPLVLGDNYALPELAPVAQTAGTVELAPCTCTFLVV